MSLFKAREWWSTVCGEREEFDRGCLCVGNIDNEPNNKSGDKIATGSFSGKLRIYHPRERGQFTADDLLIEVQLGEPILQIELGKFVPGSQSLALGILMPRKFSVYTLESPYSEVLPVTSNPMNLVDNSDEDNDNDGDQDSNFNRSGTEIARGSDKMAQYVLTKHYEHVLKRISFNFCYGPFGGVYERDFICIQSFDGQLSFFEQDHFAFSRFLSSKYLTPGPLCYSRSIDCFITYNNCLELECFRYQILAASTGSAEKEREESMGQQRGTAGKKIQPEWSIILGEEVTEICTARFSQFSGGQTEIIVLGERTLFVLKENGSLVSQRRFEFYPSCMYAYNSSKDSLSIQNLMVGTHSSTLAIFKDPRMIWSAKLHSVPVAIRTGQFGSVDGMIVTLDEQGELCVNYIGTDPSFADMSGLEPSNKSTSERKEYDYMKAEEEHRRLKSMIRQAMRSVKKEQRELLSLKISPSEISQSANNDRMVARVNLVLSNTDRNVVLQNILVNVVVPYPFAVVSGESSIVIDSIKGGPESAVTVPISVAANTSAGKEYLVTDLTAHVYTNCTWNRVAPLRQGQESGPMPRRTRGQRIVSSQFSVPLAIAGQVVPPRKIDAVKLTLETNKPSPALAELFSDIIFSEETSEHIVKDNRSYLGSGNVMTFRTYCGQEATILISRNTSRYRVQGADFASLWLMTNELCKRLETHYNNRADGTDIDQDEELVIRTADELPFHSLFDAIDNHFETRLQLKDLIGELRDRAHQFRSIQKRLLVRYMDRNPSPLNNLDVLFEHTYESLMKLSDEVERKKMELQAASCRLSNTVSLFCLLVKINLKMHPEDYAVLCRFLSPDVQVQDDPEEQGWEEITDASMTHLLRTVLARSSKERDSVPQPIIFPKDTTRVKKHIAIVVDRLVKGGSLKSLRVGYSQSSGSEPSKKKGGKKGESRTTRKDMLLRED